MPSKSPVKTPTPAPVITPDKEREGDPGELCPGQGERLTRTIAPHLPD